MKFDDKISKASIELEKYERFFYTIQTSKRSLMNYANLLTIFKKKVDEYDEVFSNVLPRNKEIKCFDCGCGYGNFLYYLRAKGYRDAIGIDIDCNAIKLAQSVGLSARVGNVIDEISKIEHVDLISAFDFIEHVDKNRAVQFLLNAFKALVPGGMIIIRCPCADGFAGSHDFFNDLTHHWGASSNLLGGLLLSIGFERIMIIDSSLPPCPQKLRRKVLFILRRIARNAIRPILRLLGINVPTIWHSSQIAVAYKPVSCVNGSP